MGASGNVVQGKRGKREKVITMLLPQQVAKIFADIIE